MKQTLLCLLRTLLTALVVLTGAIALPILLRPFFYLHIAPFHLSEQVDLSVSQIKTAYQEMMNFCIGLTDTFSAGALPFSPEGMAHFADVRTLFVLDLRVLALSAILLGALVLLQRKSPARLGTHTCGFWAAVGLGGFFLIVGGLAALDFDRAFVVFHRLFFPGKTNWLFDERTDPIILMLPEEFFRNCALLILVAIVLCCGILLVRDHRLRKQG